MGMRQNQKMRSSLKTDFSRGGATAQRKIGVAPLRRRGRNPFKAVRQNTAKPVSSFESTAGWRQHYASRLNIAPG